MENQQVQENLQVVEQVPVKGDIATKTTFGAINAPTPAWANWMFRIVFLVTTVLAAYLAATNLLTVSQKYETTLVLKVLVDPLIWGISRMFGVEVDTEVQKRIEENKK